MNWWAILYAIVGLSVAVHFAIRLVTPEPENLTPMAVQRQALPPVIIIKPDRDDPNRFEFVPR